MDKDEKVFELRLERVKLMHDFAKDGLLMLFFMFYLGGLALLFKEFRMTVLFVVMLGLFITMIGLVAAPRVLIHELDKLVPKE